MFAASKSGRASAAAATDPFFPYVPLLLNTTSTNGQQNNTFLDSSTNNFTITRSGTPTQGSVTPYWPDGYWSNLFNSTGYLSNASNAAFTFGTADFTVEYWAYCTSLPGTFTIVCGGNLGSATDIAFGFNPSSPYCTHSANWPVYTTTLMPFNAWTHLAFTRTSGTWKVYINGIDVTFASQSNPNVTTSTIGIGARSGGANGFTGYIAGLRVIKGQALNSTGNFTPPTSPVTATTVGWTGANVASSITGTVSLLTCRSNRFIDGSPSPVTLTVNNSPRVQAFQPFSPAASYTTAAYGGSMLGSTGTTTGVVVPDNAAFTCAGDFTSELWYYPLASSSFVVVMGFYDGTFQPWSIVHDTNNFTIYVSSNFSSWNIANGTVLGAVVYGQWNHLAVVRSGTSTGNLKFYINGSLATSVTYTGTIDPTQGLRFYCSSGGAYSSNARFVNGTAVYTAAFTPPTVPLTAITNTSLLLNFTNAGIYDAAVQNNAITVGDAQSSTTQSKWSPTSMKYDGTGDWLTAIDSPQLQIGTGDFTIDGWVYLSAISVAYGIISKGTATTGWSVNVTALNKLQFSYTASVLTGATSLATGTWYYFAVVRSGSATGNLKIYLNGTADATSGGAVTDNFNQTSILYVGADRIGTSALNGYLQDVRITKYARTITTPTAAFPTR